MNFPQTPVHLLETDARGNQFFLKREDLLPFSFGGNKARIGVEYLRDLRAKGCDHMVAYGNARSNLCRVLSNLCAAEKLPITIISPADDDGGRRRAFNEELCRRFGARIVPCLKTDVAGSVEKTLAGIRACGQKPYYIYGDCFGRGNEAVPTAAYVPVYAEMQAQGAWDLIALACGTGMTQAGLLCGQRKCGGQERIIGLSIARDEESARAHIAAYANAWLGEERIDESRIEVCGRWRQTYGVYDEQVEATMRRVMAECGVALDGTYTGKAYTALRRLAEAEGWENRRVLFVHTGGTPLFFDSLT